MKKLRKPSMEWSQVKLLRIQAAEKVQQVPSLSLRRTVHSRDVPSEPEGATGPGWVSGWDGGTGSTTMSKSDTFHGPGGFRTPSARQRTPRPPKQTETLQTGQQWHVRREGTTVYMTHTNREAVRNRSYTNTLQIETRQEQCSMQGKQSVL